MDKEEFKRRRNAIKIRSEKLWSEIDNHSKEEKRFIDVLHNSRMILDNIEESFEKRTSLTKADVSILMIATCMQLIRILLLSKFQEKFSDEDRMDHNNPAIKEKERAEMEKYKEKTKGWKSKKSKKGFRSWQEIAFTIKVPYDATRHSGEGFHDRNMHGGLHRVKTLGHDPVLGWLFGVANIITDTITICPEYKLGEKDIRIPYIESYKVDMGSDFCWKERITNWSVLTGCFESIREDRHRLYAGLFSQGLHLASDQYTKMGLPIPFLTLIDSDKAYEIYKEGYDYLDLLYDTQVLRNTIKSASQAILINTLVGALHKFFYNPQKDKSQKLYDVRTRKIILYSNMIATSSDIIQTTLRAYVGDEYALKNFDIGGFFVTMYRLVRDVDFIMKIKEEFIYKEWDKIIESGNQIN